MNKLTRSYALYYGSNLVSDSVMILSLLTSRVIYKSLKVVDITYTFSLCMPPLSETHSYLGHHATTMRNTHPVGLLMPLAAQPKFVSHSHEQLQDYSLHPRCSTCNKPTTLCQIPHKPMVTACESSKSSPYSAKSRPAVSSALGTEHMRSM
jgi:hypothetical protein